MTTESPADSLLDNFARLVSDAGSLAGEVRGEARNFFRAQVEALVRDMDLVPRESFDAVAEMAAKALDRIEALEARLAALEKKKGA